jgi:excisionase family DNA binding protein
MSSLLEGDMFTLQEVAAYLKVSVSSVRRLIKQQKLAAVRIGRVWRIPREALLLFLDKMAGGPNDHWRLRD